MNELQTKLNLVRKYLQQHNFDALVIEQVGNFAWLTGGAASFVNLAVTTGESSLVITQEKQYIITNNIEAPRLENEEGLSTPDWDLQIYPWYQPRDFLSQRCSGMKLAADVNLPNAVNVHPDLIQMRMNLLPSEQEKFRQLCKATANAMDAAIRNVKPGQTEFEIAALLAKETFDRDIWPIVNLVAVDDRIYKYRHPHPTHKIMEKYAMLVLCGRKYGLVSSLTRLVHLGALPDELSCKAKSVSILDAAYISATKPGTPISTIIKYAQSIYKEEGYPDEWRLHHQGGPAAFDSREFTANNDSPGIVQAGQAYAWNPSITGVKSEDTILVHENGNEILTQIHGWPETAITINGETIARPEILLI